jgi:NAD(P)H-flavin reductase
MMFFQAVKNDIYFFERIGYRNAWISITQLPMLYLLAMKANPIGWLVGMSHERINWLHRWVARIMFFTATIHGFHFWVQWEKADFTEFALQIMPLTKYGFGAWGIMLWNIITGFLPVRRLAYEFWVLQHIVSAVLMIWLLYKHIPIPARYNLWMAVAFLVFDRFARWSILGWQNVRFRPNTSSCQGGKHIGHHVSARAVGPYTTLLTVKNVHFPWKAGQFVYLWIPRIGPVESHPYTIACARRPPTGGGCYCDSIQLIVRAHGGFSKRLHAFATKNPGKNVTGFLSGPFGAPPRCEIFETVVLVGASTGASFTVPFLEDMAAKSDDTCVKRVELVLLAKTSQEIEYYVQRARDAARMVRGRGIDVLVHVAITGEKGDESPLSNDEKTVSPSASSGEDQDAIEEAPKACCSGPGLCACCVSKPNDDETSSFIQEDCCGTNTAAASPYIREYNTRPDIEALIREPVEKASGETAVIVCGGKEVVSRTRNCVSRLSDERAVHKGTGAQGIYLYVEEYSF